MKVAKLSEQKFEIQRDDGLKVADVYFHIDGWKVYPFTSARSPSRKSHPTPVAAVRSMYGAKSANAFKAAMPD